VVHTLDALLQKTTYFFVLMFKDAGSQNAPSLAEASDDNIEIELKIMPTSFEKNDGVTARMPGSN
jgi:hypothetical protein